MIDPDRKNRDHVKTVRFEKDKFYVIMSDNHPKEINEWKIEWSKWIEDDEQWHYKIRGLHQTT